MKKTNFDSGTIKDDDVERWLTKRIPLIRKQALNHPEWKNLEMHFEFWSTGKLTEAAEARIKAAKAGTGKYLVDYRDAAGILACALSTKDKALITTLNQHFLEHPLAKAELDAKIQAEKQERADKRRSLREQVVVFQGEAPSDGDFFQCQFDIGTFAQEMTMALLQTAIHQFASLNRAPGPTWTDATMRKAPHKPFLLLAVLDLVHRASSPRHSSTSPAI